MSPIHIRTMAAILAVALFLSACNLPTTAEPSPTQPDAQYTAAAETIVAQLTEIAAPPTEIPALPAATLTAGAANQEASPLPPTDTPTPEPTATPTLEPSPTFTPEAPTETATLTPSPTTAPTVTSVASDPRDTFGNASWRDTFSDGSNWPLYNDQNVEMLVREGNLEMTALKPDKWEGWMLSWPVLGNFYLELTATPQECSGRDRYGLLARAVEANKTYLFGFTCDGQYSLRKWDGDRFTMLTPWTPTSFIRTGAKQTNRLGFLAQGDVLSVYANGNLLAEVTDSSYTKGSFGLFVGSFETTEFTVLFEEMAYWELP